MSRAGYTDDCDDQLAYGRWRAQVASAIRGKRGQAFLKELLAALESMPNKRLIKNSLRTEVGEVCTLGALGTSRQMDLTTIDPEDYYEVASAFDITRQLVQEIEYENDEGVWCQETPEERWQRMHAWVKAQIKSPGGARGE